MMDIKMDQYRLGSIKMAQYNASIKKIVQRAASQF